MNALAPLPFVRPIFVLNHDYVMRRGLFGIRQLLGVAGREIDPVLVAPADAPAEAAADAPADAPAEAPPEAPAEAPPEAPPAAANGTPAD
jgi:hypothetical protein